MVDVLSKEERMWEVRREEETKGEYVYNKIKCIPIIS